MSIEPRQGPQTARDAPALTVSIIIKALNEERHIAAAIESALAAIKGIRGEVILADSASTDRTIEIARRYPIKIVQMTRIEDRCCGAGAQLGFQYSKGRYIWLVDGDMQMQPGFLASAIQFLESHPDIAGVGGMANYENEKWNGFARSILRFGERVGMRLSQGRIAVSPSLAERMRRRTVLDQHLEVMLRKILRRSGPHKGQQRRGREQKLRFPLVLLRS